MWINPLQGWNQIQRAVDRAVFENMGGAFIKSPYWPVTCLLLAKDALLPLTERLKWPPDWGGGMHDGAETGRSIDCASVNEELVQAALSITKSDKWEEVVNSDGVRVWRQFLDPNLVIAGERLGKSAQFAAIKAQGIIDAPLDTVYDLFTDNARVSEYNEYCKEVEDLQWLDPTTKVTYSSTGRPWCRDFVTRVHYRLLEDNVRLIVNR